MIYSKLHLLDTWCPRNPESEIDTYFYILISFQAVLLALLSVCFHWDVLSVRTKYVPCRVCNCWHFRLLSMHFNISGKNQFNWILFKKKTDSNKTSHIHWWNELLFYILHCLFKNYCNKQANTSWRK